MRGVDEAFYFQASAAGGGGAVAAHPAVGGDGVERVLGCFVGLRGEFELVRELALVMTVDVSYLQSQ